LKTDLHLLQQVISGESQSYQMEKRYFHADGHAVWALLAVSAVREQSGNIIHLIKQIQDISALKEKEQSLEVLNQSFIDNNDELLSKNEELKQFAYMVLKPSSFLIKKIPRQKCRTLFCSTSICR
jgi:FtsZ-binding cell division protein ZapB